MDIDPVPSKLNPLISLWLFANNDNRICGTTFRLPRSSKTPFLGHAEL